MKKADDLILYIYRKKDDGYCWEVKELGPSAPQWGIAKFLPAWGEVVDRGMAASYDEASVAGHLALQKIKQKNKGENK